MKHQAKLNSRQQEQVTHGQKQEQSAALEFPSVEQMLRHDALHTPVPPAVAARLEQSIAQLPAPSRPWWRRLFTK